MADEVNYGGGRGGNFEDTLGRLARAGQASDELNAKEKLRRNAEERSAVTEQGSVRARSDLVGATTELSRALSANIGAIASETEALALNTAQLRDQLDLRRRIAGTQIVSGGGGGGRRGGPPLVASAGGFEGDPGGPERLAAARAAQQAAILAQERARTELASARAAKLPPEQIAPLVANREQANQQAAVARRALTAAEANVVASQQQLAEQQRIIEALQAQSQADRRIALQQAEIAGRSQQIGAYAAGPRDSRETVAARGGQLALPYMTGARDVPIEEPPPQRRLFDRQGIPAVQPPLFASSVAEAATRPPTYGVTSGGPTRTMTAASEGEAAYRKELAATSSQLEMVRAQQTETNRVFQESAAIYADSSNALSRHGALSTEFIQAFARGQVTLREFGEQMVSTIGKFGGWVVAGAAVYGVFKVFEDLKNGATETQAAVQQLGRFIPGLGGPAGGGKGQVGAAETMVRGISTQFNVPISEVTEAMGVTARVFHNLSDAGEAARAVLAAARLDQVPIAQGTQFAVGISQSLGFTQGSQITGVINSLNALQAQYGARVSQTLPAVARAAPAALAANVSPQMLEVLSAMGVVSGRTGNQVGTALLRSFSNFAFRPSSLQAYAGFNAITGANIQPQLGDAGGLYRQIFDVIGARSRAGRPVANTELQLLARALGGPQLGGSVILGLLERQARNPQSFAAFERTVQHPRPYQEDLGAVLGTVSERFKSIGISLGAFGSELAQAGALQPLVSLLDAIRYVGAEIRHLVSPITSSLSVFNELPTAVQRVIGALLGFLVLRSAFRSRFGDAAHAFAGRLGGAEDYQERPRAVIRGQLANIESYVLPEERAQAERAARSLFLAAGQRSRVGEDFERFEAANAGVGRRGVAFNDTTEAGQNYQRDAAGHLDTIKTADKAVAAAQQESAAASQAYAQRQALVTILKDKQVSDEEKSSLLRAQGYEADSEYVNLREQEIAILREQVATMRAGGPGGLATGRSGLGVRAAGVTEGVAAASVATAAAVSALVNDPASLSNLQAGLASKKIILPPGAERGPSAAPPPESTAYAATAAVQQRLRDEAARSNRGIVEQLGLSGVVSGAQQRYSSVQEGIEGAGGVGAYARASLKSTLAQLQAHSGAAPFAGLIGTSLLGSAIGGGAGSYISNVGGTAFSGALIAQLLEKNQLGGLAAGAVLGNFQQNKTSGLISLAGGALGGVLAGLLASPGAIPAGAAIGATVAGAGANIFGIGKGKPTNPTADAVKVADSGIDNFTNTFTDQLTQAFGGSGSSASAASNKISAIMQNLTADLALFGPASKRGKQAQQELSVAVAAAADTFDTNPAAAQNLLQGAQTALSAMVTRTTALLKYGDPRHLDSTLAQGQAQVASIGQRTRGAVVANQQALAASRQALEARTGGASLAGIVTQGLGNLLGEVGVGANPGPQIARIQKRGQSLRDKVAELNSVLTALTAAAQDDSEQLAQLKVARADQIITSQAQIAQSRTADPAARAGIALGADAKRIASVNRTHFPTRDLQQAALGPLLAQRQSDEASYAQTQLDKLNATNQVAQNAVPSVDIVGRAATAVQGQAEAYRFMKAHENVFGPAALAQAFASLEGAQQALADAVYQQQTELVQAQGALAAAQAHGDPSGIAAAQAGTARQMLAIARTPAQRSAGQASLVEAGTAAAEAARQTADLQSQIAQESDYGNTVQQANDAIAGANRQLASAQNGPERLQAQLALLRANHQLEQAIADRYNAVAEEQASTTVDPVVQARDRVRGATRALGATVGYDNRLKAQTNLNQYTHQYEQSLIDQRTSVVDFQFQMMRITAGQAVKQLQDLTHLKGITLAQKQSLLEQIRRYETGQESPIGGTGFDLAPGNIRMPTFYDVSRGLRSARPGIARTGSTIVHAPVHNEVTVNVRRSEDVPKVVDAIERTVGGSLRTRLHAAGMR